LNCLRTDPGKYNVYVDVVKGPEQRKVPLFRDESLVGEEMELFSEKPAPASRLRLGRVTVADGNDLIKSEPACKNPASGSWPDAANLIIERVR